ncbi:YecA family protein [Thiocapsa sp.]|uniref:YecA family protein n=1 Tax=Thiocapsa sp. TaxID=2024551 RepID=UPI002B83FFB4|nr:YecA family protein [Thiocapsa sp.]HSO82037.1 YecA family protein [Thiocapsa sp.]
MVAGLLILRFPSPFSRPVPREEVATNIDDDRLARYLAAGALCATPSEAHGILCGLICGGDAHPEATWLSQLRPESDAGDLQIDEGREALSALARLTREELEASEFALTLFLPDDTRPLAERAMALYDWVRGFLYAWGTLDHTSAEPSPETREILRDFTDVTRMDLDGLDDDEQNEEALTEVSEFIRVAAMTIYQERVVARAPSPES